MSSSRGSSYVKIDIGGLGSHAAFPEGSRSPFLLADICSPISLRASPYIRFLKRHIPDMRRCPFGLNERDETFGYTTHICGTIGIQHGEYAKQVINVGMFHG